MFFRGEHIQVFVFFCFFIFKNQIFQIRVRRGLEQDYCFKIRRSADIYSKSFYQEGKQLTSKKKTIEQNLNNPDQILNPA